MQYLRRFLVLAVLLGFAGTAVSQPIKINPNDLRNGPKMLQTFRPIVAKPSESTVRILADGKEVAFGTVVDADGWIITKWSEVKDAKVTVKLKDGKVLPAEVRGVKDDPTIEGAYDLVMLKIEAKDLKAVEWRNSKEATVGKWVASAGIGTDPVAVGVISVGTRLFKLGDQPPKFSNFDSGYLGIQLEPAMGGAKITIVTPKGPAEKAGLKVNDLVYEAAGKQVTDVEGLINTIGKFKPNEKVLLKLKRGEEDLEITATLGVRPKELKGNPQETMGTKLSQRRGGFPVILQHDSGVRPEDCGGPLVDLDGKTVGINIARAGRTETFAIPAEHIQPLLADLKSGKLAPKAVTVAAKSRTGDFVMRANLSATNQTAKSRPDRFMRVEEVQLIAGETYLIEMTTDDKRFDPFIIIEDAKGKEVAKDDDGGGFPNAKLVFRAPTSGVYRIICTTFNPNETGDYTLSVRRQGDDKEKSQK